MDTKFCRDCTFKGPGAFPHIPSTWVCRHPDVVAKADPVSGLILCRSARGYGAVCGAAGNKFERHNRP